MKINNARPSKKTAQITPLMWSRYCFVCNMLKKYMNKENPTCIEIGAGIGDFLRILEEKNFSKIKAVDLSEENVRIAKSLTKKTEISQGNLFDINEKFDVVIMLEVLEHIQNDRKALLHVSNNLLINGGLFILSVPSHNSPTDLNFGHYRHYRKEDLKNMLQESGFNILLFYSYGSKIIDRLGTMLLRKRYGSEHSAKTKLDITKESARFELPFIWNQILYPLLSPFYILFHLMDYCFIRHTDGGVDYLVLCQKV